MKHYDYIVSGAGLYGYMMAYRLTRQANKYPVIAPRHAAVQDYHAVCGLGADEKGRGVSIKC